MFPMIIGVAGAFLLTLKLPPSESTGAMWIVIALISAIQANKK